MKPWQLICALGLIALIGARPVAQSDDDRSSWTIRDGRFVGGSVDDRADAIAVDAAGNSYVVGMTDSPDFPLSAFVPLAEPSFRFRGFIARTDAVTGTLSFRYVDGTPTAVAVGADGNPVIAAGMNDGAVVVTKFVGPTLDLIYSTNVISGSCCGTIALAIDPAGNAVTAGATYDYTVGSEVAGFVVKLDARGRQLFSRRIPDGVADALAVDGSGSVFVSGMTYSTAFATTAGAFQRTEQGRYPCVVYDAPFPCPNAFVIKLSDAGSLVYSTLLGGEGLGTDHTRLAVNAMGEAFLAGAGPATAFPLATRSLFQACEASTAPPCNGQFIARLTGDGSALESVSFLKGVTVNTLAVDRSDRLVVGGATSTNALPTRAAVQPRHAGGPIFRTSDNGATWSPSSAGLAAIDVEAITVSRVAPVVAYAATSAGVFRTTDRSQTWSSAGLANEHVYRLVLDPRTPSIAYAATYTVIFKTMDGGANWTAVSRDLSNWNPATLTIAASAPSTLYLATASGVFRTIDGGSTWRLGAPSIRGVRALAVDARDASTVYALGTDGFARSRDGASTWSAPTSIAPDPGSVAGLWTDPVIPSTLFAYGSGVYRSSDGGATWQSVLGPSVVGSSLTIDPSTPPTLYVATNDDGLFSSVDAGVSWTRHASRLRNVFDMAGDPSQRGALYANLKEANRTGFIAVLDNDPLSVSMATYFGGAVDDQVTGVALDRDGRIYVAGVTRSQSMPFDGARPPALAGTTDAYVAVLGRTPQRGPQPRDPK
jgi:photosystem II stability/assembly factor-like uncharacterized protein